MDEVIVSVHNLQTRVDAIARTVTSAVKQMEVESRACRESLTDYGAIKKTLSSRLATAARHQHRATLRARRLAAIHPEVTALANQLDRLRDTEEVLKLRRQVQHMESVITRYQHEDGGGGLESL